MISLFFIENSFSDFQEFLYSKNRGLSSWMIFLYIFFNLNTFGKKIKYFTYQVETFVWDSLQSISCTIVLL